MRIKSPMLLLVAANSIILSGCGSITPAVNPSPVAISGSVAQGGKPVSDLVLNLQPTGPGALPVTVALKNGQFEAEISPGRYTWYLSEGSEKSSKKAFESVAESFRAGSLERQIDVSPGGRIELELM